MASNATIAKPYARAVFSIALETESLSAWLDFMQKAAIVVIDKHMVPVISDPTRSDACVLSLMEDILSDVLVHEQQRSFLHVLVEAKRLNVLADIADMFYEQVKNYENTVEVDVSTRYPLGALEEKLTEALTKRLQRKVKLNVTEDPTVLGGAVIRAGDLVIDGSITGKLARLQDSLLNYSPGVSEADT